MKSLDHRLRRLVQKSQQDTFDPLAESVLAPRSTEGLEEPLGVEVLVRCSNPAVGDRLQEEGMEVWGKIEGAYTVVTGVAPLEVLATLSDLEGVERLEASRPLAGELDLSRVDSGVEPLHIVDLGSPTVRGEGVMVGIIDTGIDYRHPKFRHSDGSSRILFLWDQQVPGQHPGVPFGRQYTKAELDAALADEQPLDLVPHRDRDGHGTHVAGIAAGNGRGGLRFRGVAPDADLIIVASRSDGETLGRSASSLAAYQYIVDRAEGQPVAMNQSQGMNGGGHSGETVLETGIDNLLRRPNVMAVKSAGNEQRWRIHAGGEVEEGTTEKRRFQVQQGNSRTSVLELWYDDQDTISLAVKPPGEEALPFVSPDEGDQVFVTEAGNEVSIQFDRDADETGDTQATLEISPHQGSVIRPGKWRLELRGDSIRHGRFDIWIERQARGQNGRFQARFRPSSADNTRTISIPGTSRRILTVGSYITRGEPFRRGRISDFSSRGPTRMGRQKPELTAPGESIISARSSDSSSISRPPNPNDLHTSMPGTSMAAPHVTGAAALVLSRRPGLTSEQVKQILVRSARIDSLSDDAPDNTWGAGKLDTAAAVSLAETVTFPEFLEVRIEGTELSWVTDLPTTATVRVHTSRRRLLLGRSLSTSTQLLLGTQHQVDFSSLEQGTWFCEILAFSEEGFRTTNDNEGACYVVVVD